MTADRELQNLIDLVQDSADPVCLMCDLVLADGGFWSDADHSGLFEVQYLGIIGIGLDAQSAVRNWLAQAANQKLDLERAV